MAQNVSSIDSLINADTDSRTLAPAAVGSQVLLMSIISAAAIVIFNVLRPKNKIIYEPKVKYHVGNKPPPRISDSIFGWIPPLLHTKEPELVDKLGLDAVTFLRFTRMSRWLYSCIAFITCAVLIPINAVYNLRYVPSSSRDALSMLTIRNVSGDWLFVHVGVTYIIMAMIMFFVYRNWQVMLRLRNAWFRSPEYMESFYARTLAVMHVPRSLQSDEGIKAIFESVQVPYPTTSVHIGRRVGRLPELIEYHNKAVRELEQVLVTYLKGGHIAKERPTIRIGGFLGMGGVKKDAIDFYTAKLKRTEQAIEDYRTQIDTRKPENYGFASMAAVPFAHIVAHMLRNKHPKGTDITLAPNPKDIIWENLNKSQGELVRRRLLGFFWMSVVCFFNTIPLFIISVLANLSSLTAFVPFLASWSKASPGSFAVVSGVLPPAVSALFGFFLPHIMRRLSQYMGALTHSRLDRAVVARYYAFLIISQLVIFTLIGVIFNCVQQIIVQIGDHYSFAEIIDNLDTLPATINQTYIDQASYWLTFFPLRGFLVVFDLAQIVNLLWISFKTRVFGRTPRDIREWTQPPEFQYAVYYSNTLYMGAVALVFAPLAPLVAAAGAIVFWISSWVYKYQLMFVYVTQVETGGRLWNSVVNRIFVAFVLMQLLMMLTIGLQYGFRSFLWLTTAPPIIFIIAFKIWIDRKFYNQFTYYIPSDEELRDAKVHSARADSKGNRLEKRFAHPAMHTELFTPMLHAKMMHLLGEVYKGKIGSEEAKMDELGGQKMDAQVVEGGVKIAAIGERDLEYDPIQYQRDRGELDWDQRSMSSSNVLGGTRSDGASIFSKHNYAQSISGRASPAPSNYERYLTKGPSMLSAQSDIELSRLDLSTDQLPLLHQQQPVGYYDNSVPPVPSLPPGIGGHLASPSDDTASLSNYTFSASTPHLHYVPPVPPVPDLYQEPSEGYRQAPLHRPSTLQRPQSRYQDQPPSENMAGRGVYRGH